VEDPERGVYAVFMFHPEVAHSHQGTRILRNFLFEVLRLPGD